jgi:hypothetical protein
MQRFTLTNCQPSLETGNKMYTHKPQTVAVISSELCDDNDDDDYYYFFALVAKS